MEYGNMGSKNGYGTYAGSTDDVLIKPSGLNVDRKRHSAKDER